MPRKRPPHVQMAIARAQGAGQPAGSANAFLPTGGTVMRRVRPEDSPSPAAHFERMTRRHLPESGLAAVQAKGGESSGPTLAAHVQSSVASAASVTRPPASSPAQRWREQRSSLNGSVQRAVLKGGASGASGAPARTFVAEADFSGETVPSYVLDEIDSMLQAAARAGGGATVAPAPTLGHLSTFDQNFTASTNVNSQQTYGVGGSSFFPGTFTMATVGSGAYGTKIKQEADKVFSSTSANHLGTRESCVHAEVAIISDYPGVQAVHTTQDACLFCYGLLAKRGYQHQAMRANPWPQAWTHDYLGFKIQLVGVKQVIPKGAIMEITWSGDTRYYRVTESDG